MPETPPSQLCLDGMFIFIILPVAAMEQFWSEYLQPFYLSSSFPASPNIHELLEGGMDYVLVNIAHLIQHLVHLRDLPNAY